MGFVKTTVIGGVLFLIPIVVLIAVIGKGLEVTSKIAEPLAANFPMEQVGAFAVAHLVAIAILILICFGAGLLAKSALARRLVDSLEANFLSKLPPYALMKTKTQSMLSPDDIEGMTPVVVRFDDSWQIAFEMERIEPDKVALFLPGAPDAWAGSVCVVTQDRVTPLDLTIPFVAKMEKRLGRGVSEAFRERVVARQEGN